MGALGGHTRKKARKENSRKRKLYVKERVWGYIKEPRNQGACALEQIGEGQGETVAEASSWMESCVCGKCWEFYSELNAKPLKTLFHFTFYSET